MLHTLKQLPYAVHQFFKKKWNYWVEKFSLSLCWWLCGEDFYCCCLSGLQRARHRSQRDHHQSGVLLQSEGQGPREGQSHQCSGSPDPWRHPAGGAHSSGQVLTIHGVLTTALEPVLHPGWCHKLWVQGHPLLLSLLQWVVKICQDPLGSARVHLRSYRVSRLSGSWAVLPFSMLGSIRILHSPTIVLVQNFVAPETNPEKMKKFLDMW